jgi:hypothetical protein
MPEYEGMSKDEKAYSWIKMGMAIASGQSPNAIKNIADGVLATIDEFADDPKKKRAYEQQVLLAASKYGIERFNAVRDKELAFEEAEKDLVMIMHPETKEQRTITKGDLRAGNVPAGFLVTTDPMGDLTNMIKQNAAFIKAVEDLLDDQKPPEIDDPQKYNTMDKEYINANMQLINSSQAKQMLGPAIEIAFSDDPPTGLKSAMQLGWNKLSNSIGWNVNDGHQKKGEKIEEYKARVQGAIATKITAILGESNRTISDKDRERAQELAGLWADYLTGMSFADPDIIKIRLRNLWTLIDNDEKRARGQVKIIEEGVGTIMLPGGNKSKYDSYIGIKNELFGGGVRRATDTGYEIIPYNEMFDIKTGKLLS